MTDVSIGNSVAYSRKELPRKNYILGIIAALIGLVGIVLGYVLEPERASFNMIVVFTWVVSIGIGSIFLIGIEYLTGAVWSVPFRRIAEINSSLVLLAPILAIPVILNIHSIYHWAHAESIINDEILKNKSPYLNQTFFIVRFVVTFLVWFLFYFLITQTSSKQDISRDQRLTKRNTVISAIFMPIFAITLTFFSIDWLMSLEPHWYSTIFGVYFFSGTVLASIAIFTFASITLNESGFLVEGLNRQHYYSMGALLFAFTNFWAYIAFSQFMLIWYANLPEETFWFIHRGVGNWMYWSIGIVLVKFIVPYVFLLPQPAKMDPTRLKLASLWILFAHYYDLYWIVMPTYSKNGVVFGWLELSAIVFSIGLLVVSFHLFAKGRNLVPIGDPKLKRGVEFHL